MKKIDFYEVCELIENSVFVDSTDEVRVSDDACSVRITSVGTIDREIKKIAAKIARII